MYTEQQLVSIAKRENNKKRSYLVVNPMQGKHVPVRPVAALQLFADLAQELKRSYSGEKLLLIGFAETATAIGAAAANELDCLYMQTTREAVADVEYLFFSEAHSHATEQKLVANDLDKVADEIDRIVFIEDEVTTGNTIWNIIQILYKKYPQIKHYAVASLLNGMNEASLQHYREHEIDLFYMIKTNHDTFSEIADAYEENGRYVKASKVCTAEAQIRHFEIESYMDTRRMVDMKAYRQAVDKLAEAVVKLVSEEDEEILVLGTEEFMYPALYAAERLEAEGKIVVRCHATTRSPIAVCDASDYPLHTRYELISFYEDSRVTYIYDLRKYDHVLVLTDAKESDGIGAHTLIHALLENDNKKIDIIRWC